MRIQFIITSFCAKILRRRCCYNCFLQTCCYFNNVKRAPRPANVRARRNFEQQKERIRNKENSHCAPQRECQQRDYEHRKWIFICTATANEAMCVRCQNRKCSITLNDNSISSCIRPCHRFRGQGTNERAFAIAQRPKTHTRKNRFHSELNS